MAKMQSWHFAKYQIGFCVPFCPHLLQVINLNGSASKSCSTSAHQVSNWQVSRPPKLSLAVLNKTDALM